MELVKQEKQEGADAPFYEDAAKYWESIPPTVDGMLGGYGFVSKTDIQGSKRFLDTLFKIQEPPGKDTVIDCGAGIGRIAQNLLQHVFSKVDLVEQNANFLKEAKKLLGGSRKIGKLYCSGLQNFQPEEGYYDVIWCQWVLGHLTDDHLIKFFERCRLGLKPRGVLVVKENLTSSGAVEVDDTDSSVTRPASILIDLMQKAGLKIIREQKQLKFPKDLYEVRMYALRPENPSCESTHAL